MAKTGGRGERQFQLPFPEPWTPSQEPSSSWRRVGAYPLRDPWHDQMDKFLLSYFIITQQYGFSGNSPRQNTNVGNIVDSALSSGVLNGLSGGHGGSYGGAQPSVSGQQGGGFGRPGRLPGYGSR